jgi:hypothetical protein
MVPIKEFRVEFVQYMPDSINQGVLYVSMQYSLVIHLCACGCGEKVATPLSPDDWNLLFDGETVSLYPSIGNWDFPCESHYWIRRNKVITAGKRYKEEVSSWKSKDKKYKPPIITKADKLKSQLEKHTKKKKR